MIKFFKKCNIEKIVFKNSFTSKNYRPAICLFNEQKSLILKFSNFNFSSNSNKIVEAPVIKHIPNDDDMKLNELEEEEVVETNDIEEEKNKKLEHKLIDKKDVEYKYLYKVKDKMLFRLNTLVAHLKKFPEENLKDYLIIV